MARPEIERAQEREAIILSIPIGILLGHESQHRAVFIQELRIFHPVEGRTESEISIVKMLIVKAGGIVTLFEADQRAKWAGTAQSRQSRNAAKPQAGILGHG